MSGDDDERAWQAWAYAAEKVGFIVTEMNRHTFTTAELAAWDAALDEWEQANP